MRRAIFWVQFSSSFSTSKSPAPQLPHTSPHSGMMPTLLWHLSNFGNLHHLSFHGLDPYPCLLSPSFSSCPLSPPLYLPSSSLSPFSLSLLLCISPPPLVSPSYLSPLLLFISPPLYLPFYFVFFVQYIFIQ